MASIKWLVVLITWAEVHYHYEKSIFRITLTLMVGGLLSGVIILTFWPVSLYYYKLNYFKYPDKYIQSAFIKRFEMDKQ